MRTAALPAGLLALATMQLPIDAAAQAQPLPGAVQPGQIERQFETLPEPKAVPAPLEVPAPAAGVPADAQSIRFVLREVMLAGGTVYAPEALRADFAAYLGREITLADLYDLAARLTARYRNDGYILSQVVVPAQAIEAGVVRLEAVEGYIDAVRVEGDSGGAAERVAAHLESVRNTRPLTARALERHLLLVNDLAGTHARATLSPAPGRAGAAEFVVHLSHRPITASVQVDNRGSKALGPWRTSAEIEFNSRLGLHERASLRAVTTANRELDYLAAGYEQPVGASGLRLGATLSAVEARPDLGARLPVDLASSSRSAVLTATYPWLRARSSNAYLRAALTAHDSRTELAGLPNSRDRVRALRLGTAFDLADRWRGITLVDLEFSQGIDGLGATRSGSPGISRAHARSDFAKLNLYAARLQSLAARWSLLGAASLQHAFASLPGSELYAFGGEQFGRGYDASELVGDSGAALKFELRYTGRSDSALLPGYTAYGFYDLGGVRRRNPINEAAAESAASAGAGLRLDFGPRLSAYIEAARPLTRRVAEKGDRDARLFAAIAARF